MGVFGKRNRCSFTCTCSPHVCQVMRAPLCFSLVEFIHNSAWDAPSAPVFTEADGAVVLMVCVDRTSPRGWECCRLQFILSSKHSSRAAAGLVLCLLPIMCDHVVVNACVGRRWMPWSVGTCCCCAVKPPGASSSSGTPSTPRLHSTPRLVSVWF